MSNKDYEIHIDKLRGIFNDIFKESCKMDENLDLFKKQQIPIARIKKVMKTDEDVNVSLKDGQQRRAHNNGKGLRVVHHRSGLPLAIFLQEGKKENPECMLISERTYAQPSRIWKCLTF